VFTGKDIAAVCTPLLGIARHRAGHKSAPQPAMAVDKVVWQGEPVAAVVARSRAIAEDAAELVAVEWKELPAVVDAEPALAPGAAVIHPSLGDNHAFTHTINVGEPDRAFAEAHLVVEHVFRFDRQTGLPLEPRVIIAYYDPSAETLTVTQSHQSPYQMADIYCQHLGIPEHKVRVIAPDMGGGFGTKINVYGDELAVAAISKLVGRPVKYCVDRLESFVADAHSRDHVITARLAVADDGTITAMEMDDLAALGAYGMARRFSVAEGMMAITNNGAPYRFQHYRARTRNAYVNTGLIGMYRGVGVPLACVATEVLTDMAAARLGVDTVAFKRKNYRRLDEQPYVSPGGIPVDGASYHPCLDRLVEIMGYDGLRQDQAALRSRGVWRGIGISTFVEATAYGPAYYGPSEARISVQDGCTVRLEPTGKIRCVTSVTDQGQGTLTGLAQIMAGALGVAVDDVDVIAGDSAISPYGGGAWASRGMAMGGEAALKAALALRANILALAGAITQADPKDLDIENGAVVNRRSRMAAIGLAEVGKVGYFRQDTLPADFDVQLSVTRSHVVNNQLYYTANGITGVHLELDADTGLVRLLGIWAVDDCGRVVNPLLVDEQVRGGIVQGIGATLYEHCVYGADGQLQNGTMADYLVPMAAEMPEIVVAHVETPERTTLLGAKGVGEAGTIGAMGAVWVAVNDALRPLGAAVHRQPFTPERILEAIRTAR
jgi:carbon-monoxide dehydrogenase large subunit